ncbi:MAG: hypothetical protein HYU66_24075, partial [Armatimonadetes bacterium]|nr:hypothetical protein [Armatimonadota bacterium]
DKVKAELAAGRRAIPATNAFAGRDPVANVVKELRIDFTVNGQKQSQRVEENATLTLPEGAEVVLAWYGLVDDRPAGEVDVTKQLQALVKNGRLEVAATNGLAGDPVPLVVKQMRVDYHYNGVAGTRVVGENQVLRLPPDGNELGDPPGYDLAEDAAGKRWLTAWQPGTYTVALAGGGKAELKLDPPPPAVVDGAWMLRFPPDLGAPAEVTLPKLISWTEHAEPGVRYFSGTAEYVRDLTIPAGLPGPGRALELDLGKVRNFAEVTLNGHAFGVLWKPPYRVDITGVAKAGRNVLSVKVTNLWANRLIGDEQIDDGRQWAGDGRLQAWPDWLVQGKPKPDDGRVAWTTWRHYTKGSALQESGLIGPVTLRAGLRQEVR